MQATDNNTSLDAYLKIIAEMIGQLEYGSLKIIVQDGKIVQIDKTEKRRMKN